MRSITRFLVLATLGSVVLWSSSSAQTMSSSGSVVPTSWGHIKAMYGVDNLAQSAPNSGSTPVTQTPYEPWALQPAQEVMQKFHLPTSNILAVQKVVAYQNSMPADSAMVVVTDKQWYYVSLTDHLVYDTEPPSFRLSTEMDVYGSYLAIVTNSSYCWSQEWVAVFFMPACLTWNGNSFNEVVDAWAPTPGCGVCNGGLCAGFKCGPAWPYSGKVDWYSFRSCASPTSKKVGKIVQKRWMYTWNLCYGYSFDYIASTVRARIRI